MSTTGNTFVWYELMTTDADAAEAFYRAVIGWSTRDSGQPGIRYTLLTAGETPVAGLMTLPEEVRQAGGRPGWIGYVGVDDIGAAVARLTEAGGTVHRAPADIPGVGRFAVVADPQGAVFMLFEAAPRSERPNIPPGTPGHVMWHELSATDWPSAFAFYADQFGWTKGDALDMGPMGTYQLFAADGNAIGGMMNKPDAASRPAWLFYVAVEGIDAAIARINAAGGQVLHGPAEVPGGAWIVQAKDPQGAMFALVGPRG